MRGMILCAGLGSRLRPLTAERPKPLVPLLNRPLLWYLIASLRAAGIHEIAVNLHYRGDQIHTWLGSGEHLGIQVLYSLEPQLLGSGGGVQRVRDFFGTESALIVHGDILFDLDLRKVIEYHQSYAAHATVVLQARRHRYSYGMIKVNAQGEIGQFVDQLAPSVPGPFMETIFTGVQILEPEVLDLIPTDRASILTTDIYPRLLTSRWRFYGYVMRGYWSDLGTPYRYWEANMDVVSGRVVPVGGPPPNGPELRGVTRPQQGARGAIQAPVVLAPAVEVSDASSIGPEVVLGESCQVASGARILQSVLWPHVRVGVGATIERSIVANDVAIPAGSHLAGKIVSSSGITDL